MYGYWPKICSWCGATMEVYQFKINIQNPNSSKSCSSIPEPHPAYSRQLFFPSLVPASGSDRAPQQHQELQIKGGHLHNIETSNIYQTVIAQVRGFVHPGRQNKIKTRWLHSVSTAYAENLLPCHLIHSVAELAAGRVLLGHRVCRGLAGTSCQCSGASRVRHPFLGEQ